MTGNDGERWVSAGVRIHQDRAGGFVFGVEKTRARATFHDHLMTAFDELIDAGGQFFYKYASRKIRVYLRLFYSSPRGFVALRLISFPNYPLSN